MVRKRVARQLPNLNMHNNVLEFSGMVSILMPHCTHRHRLRRSHYLPMSIAHASRDVRASLNYFRALDSRPPYIYVHDPPAGIMKENLGVETCSVQISDARGHQSKFTLDNSGFQFMRHVSAEDQFDEEQRIQKAYYREIEELLMRETAAKRVHIFDHTVRSALHSTVAENEILS